MPRVHESEVDGWVHCPDPRCDGYRQQEAKVRHTVKEILYTDLGGDMPGVERSVEYVALVDPKDGPCPTCERPREASLQKRRVIPPLTGHAQDGLLRIKHAVG